MHTDRFGIVRSKKVMIIDNNKIINDSLKTVFEIEGCNLLTARNQLEAYELAQDTIPDVVLCEYDLIKREGLVFLKKVKKINPDVITVMFFSISYGNSIPVEYYFWVDKIIYKPFTTEVLIEKLNRLLKKTTDTKALLKAI